MPARLRANNFVSQNIKQATLFNADAASAATTISVENSSGIITNDFAYLGGLGTESCEKRAVTVSANSFTVSPLTYNHKRFDPITAVFGDQILFYAAPNIDGSIPSDNTFVPIGSPIDIVADQLFTQYTDPTGGSDFWYKYVYWNSYSGGAVTDISDSVAVRGGDIGMYVSSDEVRNAAGFNRNQNITDVDIVTYIVKAVDEINSALNGFYSIPFAAPVPQTIVNIAKLLSAGYLLIDQYGIFTNGSSADGQAKIDEAHKLLTQVQQGVLQVFDYQGNDLRIGALVAGWPNDTTWQTGEKDPNSGEPLGGGGPIFTIGHVF